MKPGEIHVFPNCLVGRLPNRKMYMHKTNTSYHFTFISLREDADKPACHYDNPRKYVSVAQIAIKPEGAKMMADMIYMDLENGYITEITE